MARVSILMNCYNCSKYLKEAIDSIYNQTFQDWEIIFIDNCSNDLSAQIAKSYDSRLKYYKTDLNTNLGLARNFGLKYCDSEYLAFLDTDDIWLPTKLSQQVMVLDSNKEFKMCYSAVQYINEQGNEIGTMIPKAVNGNVFSQQLNRYEINMQSVMIRNDIEISFNESMEYSPDFDLFMKLCSQYDTYVFKEVLVKYRKLSNSLSSNKINRWWIETKETLDDIFSKDISLKDKYKIESEMAYAKVVYYKARYFVSINRMMEARKLLSNIKFIDFKFFVLYIILFFPKNVWDFIHNVKNK